VLNEVTGLFRPRHGSLELINLVLESLAMRLVHTEPIEFSNQHRGAATQVA
jgi:hypothetical protein